MEELEYKILSRHFHYSKTSEYKVFYTGNKQKTNEEILEIYKENIGYPDVDLLVIEDLTHENNIEINPENIYLCFVKETEDTYRFLNAFKTSDDYNNIITNFNGDISKLIFARNIINELTDKNKRK